jgi:glycosyltransferase involved in cell wall biosynthesis
MPEQIKISVLMPTYNRADMLPYAIRSILSQTYQNFEFIIYDDGSTDSTFKIVHKFNDKRIIHIRSEENKGCAWARNHMLDVCTGPIACWQDSDDISNIHRLKMQLKAIQAGHHIVVSRFRWFGKPKQVKWQEKPPMQGDMAHASAMFNMKNVVKVNLALSGGGSDADWLRKMQKKFGPYHLMKPALYYVRKHSNRIGIWKRKPARNSQWSKRMAQYKKKR